MLLGCCADRDPIMPKSAGTGYVAQVRCSAAKRARWNTFSWLRWA